MFKLLLFIAAANLASGSVTVLINHCHGTECDADPICVVTGTVVQNVAECETVGIAECSVAPAPEMRAQSRHCYNDVDEIAFPHALLDVWPAENTDCSGPPAQTWVIGLNHCYQNETTSCDATHMRMKGTNSHDCSDGDAPRYDRNYPLGTCLSESETHYPATTFIRCPSPSARRKRSVVVMKDVTPPHWREMRKAEEALLKKYREENGIDPPLLGD